MKKSENLPTVSFKELLCELNQHFADNSYVEGFKLSQVDLGIYHYFPSLPVCLKIIIFQFASFAKTN